MAMSRAPTAVAAQGSVRTRIVVIGGGFGGAYTVQHLEKLFRRRADVEILHVSRDNFFLMTPLLFEACSGNLELRHCAVAIRAFRCRGRFLEATVRHVDLEQRIVHAVGPAPIEYDLPYDQLVLALGSVTHFGLVPGSENAFTFKTLADAVVLRNHVIEQFERADVETDPARKQKLLTLVFVGAGLVGIELLGELTAFVDEIVCNYRHIRRDEVRFVAVQAGDRIMPEMAPALGDYAARVLRGRVGVEIRTETPVQSIERERVHLPHGETIEAATVVFAAGVAASPVVAALPVEKGRHGQIVVDATMRCPSRPEVWALGDCASVPGPDGRPYPTLAQHALREAAALASNICAVVCGRPPRPFVYRSLGMMGSLGHGQGFVGFFRFRLRGFFAWWLRQTYYLLQVPGFVRRLRVVIDWTLALFFRPDVVKIDLAREAVLLLRDAPAGGVSDAQLEAKFDAAIAKTDGRREEPARIEERI
jgi:NADH:ubiquinone reductase (H+-translocating)